MYLYEKIQQEKIRQKQMKDVESLQVYRPLPDKRYISVLGSAAHTYGNALAFIQNWVINLFPKDMFKTIHVNSKIAHRQLRNTPHEYVKKARPMIIFRPRIAERTEERFLKGTPLIERITDNYSTYGLTNLQPFFKDNKNDLAIKYQLQRTVMYVDVTIVLSTLMQQLDYYSYIENSVRIEHPFFLSTYLESYIPMDMLKIVSDCVNIPLFDDHGNTKEFIEYMNSNSMFPITYKLQGSTQSREFYRYYPCNIDTTITDLNRDDGEKSGTVMDHYNITFTVKAEYISTGFYFIFSDRLYDIHFPEIHAEDTDIIPIFTDVIQREDLNLRDGWQLYNRGSCRLEDPNDTIDFDQMLNHSIREVLNYHQANGLPIFDFIDLKIRKQGVMINEGIEYTVDWVKKEIHFHKQNTFSTYTILICTNIEYINNLVKTIYKLK